MAKLRGQGQLEPVGPLVTLEHESQLGRGKPLLVVEKFPPAERAREIRSFPATAEGVTPDVRAPPSQSGGRRVPPLPRWRHSWDRKELRFRLDPASDVEAGLPCGVFPPLPPFARSA